MKRRKKIDFIIKLIVTEYGTNIELSVNISIFKIDNSVYSKKRNKLNRPIGKIRQNSYRPFYLYLTLVNWFATPTVFIIKCGFRNI